MKPSQSVLDSLADAETLRINDGGVPPFIVPLLLRFYTPTSAYVLGKVTARSAFRACPGLRG